MSSSNAICPRCNADAIATTETGAEVCENCGLVIEEISYRSEVAIQQVGNTIVSSGTNLSSLTDTYNSHTRGVSRRLQAAMTGAPPGKVRDSIRGCSVHH
jgi:transcription initiation factor TFIIIB Brf1 subunit/transcription initiation factor TFIIB